MILLAGICFFIFGSLIGSFLNVVTLRLPTDKTLSGRSACPLCGAGLVFYDLIPVVSYVLLRGKCRYCHKKIASRYFIIELVTASCFALVACYFFSSADISYINLLRWLVATALFIVIFIIDLEHFLILDKILIFGGAVFLVLNFIFDFQNGINFLSLNSSFLGGVIAGLIVSTIFFLLWYFSKGRWMGFGDVKLVFLLGLILGWPQTFVMLLLAFWFGAVVSAPLLFLGKKKLQSAVPFGTFLTVASFITLFFGPSLLSWYLRIIGFSA